MNIEHQNFLFSVEQKSCYYCNGHYSPYMKSMSQIKNNKTWIFFTFNHSQVKNCLLWIFCAPKSTWKYVTILPVVISTIEEHSYTFTKNLHKEKVWDVSCAKTRMVLRLQVQSSFTSTHGYPDTRRARN